MTAEPIPSLAPTSPAPARRERRGGLVRDTLGSILLQRNARIGLGILAFFVPQALVVLVVMVPAMVIPLYRQGKRVSKRSSKSLQAMGETTESLNQILNGIRTVKAFQLEAPMLRDFEATTATFLQRAQHMLRAKGRSMAQTFVGYQLGFGVLLVMLGYVVIVQGEIGRAHV